MAVNYIEIPYAMEAKVPVAEKGTGTERQVMTPVVGASISIAVRAGGKGTAALYGARTGGTPVASPVTDANGNSPYWAREGSYTLTFSGGTPSIGSLSVDWDPVGGSGPNYLGTDAILPTAQLESGAALANLAAGSITGAKIASATVAGSNMVAKTITKSLMAASSVGEPEIAAGSIVTSHIKAGQITSALMASASVSDSNIADNRALTVTSNSYGARTARVIGTEYEPSSSRLTLACVDVSLSPAEHFGKAAVAFVGGVQVGEVFFGGIGPAPESGVRYSMTFLVPPGQKWKVTDGTGSGGVAGLFSSYLFL
jgi:uncharacterized protein with ACT and thioredoxin-like domain